MELPVVNRQWEISQPEENFMVVCHPYPSGYPNMEAGQDAQKLALWLACILGDHDYLLSLRYKPSSPLVVFGVSGRFTELRKLLGAHEWSYFLKSPEPDEAGKVSKIFPCRYKTAGEIQKAAWKECRIKESWFYPEGLEWRRMKAKIKDPYPVTGRCGLPGDNVNKDGLCLPLPADLFPPPKTPKLAPGSSGWVQEKTGGPSLLRQPKVCGAWSKGAPAIKAAKSDAWLSLNAAQSITTVAPAMTRGANISSGSTTSNASEFPITPRPVSLEVADPDALDLSRFSISEDTGDIPDGHILPLADSVTAPTTPVDPTEDLWRGHDSWPAEDAKSTLEPKQGKKKIVIQDQDELEDGWSQVKKGRKQRRGKNWN